MEKNQSNKKEDVFFAWFSGTDTTAELSKEAFMLAEKAKTKKEPKPSILDDVAENHIYITDGVGTTENTQKEQKNNRKKYPIRTRVALLRGHTKKTQEAQVQSLADKLEKLKSPVDLVLGGHSRGAAAGVIGFLAYLAKLKSDNPVKFNAIFENIKHIRVIGADPVQGPFPNYLYGIEKKLGKEDLIHNILEEITPESRDINEFFDISIILPRLDPVKQLIIDKNWQEFITNHPKSCQKYYLGISHGAFMQKNKAVERWYVRSNGSKVTPNEVFRSFIKKKLLPSRNADVSFEKKYARLQEKETQLLNAKDLAKQSDKHRKNFEDLGKSIRHSYLPFLRSRLTYQDPWPAIRQEKHIDPKTGYTTIRGRELNNFALAKPKILVPRGESLLYNLKHCPACLNFDRNIQLLQELQSHRQFCKAERIRLHDWLAIAPKNKIDSIKQYDQYLNKHIHKLNQVFVNAVEDLRAVYLEKEGRALRAESQQNQKENQDPAAVQEKIIAHRKKTREIQSLLNDRKRYLKKLKKGKKLNDGVMDDTTSHSNRQHRALQSRPNLHPNNRRVRQSTKSQRGI